MIRKLQVSDRIAVKALLETDYLLNLFLLSNIIQPGFDSVICEFWGDFSDTGGGVAELRGIVSRYLTGWMVYGRDDADWSALAEIVDTHPVTAARLQDNPGGVESFVPYLQTYTMSRLSEEELMVLDEDDFCELPHEGNVRRATMDDLDLLVGFYADAEHMSRSREAVARPLQDLRVWIALENGVVQAAALTNAELDDAAMIGGVYTRPDARGRGLSSAVCSELCAELLAEKKQPALYWETPAAGKVYRRLGFHSIGKWRSVWLARQ